MLRWSRSPGAARHFAPAAKAVGIEKPRPYDLRHSLASLLFSEGRNAAEIAEIMGHSVQTLLGTYVAVIEELRGHERESAEVLIQRARAQHDPQRATKAFGPALAKSSKRLR